MAIPERHKVIGSAPLCGNSREIEPYNQSGVRIKSEVRSAKSKLSLKPQLVTRLRPLRNPIVPGDHPDPSIVLVNGTFWASSTSGEWSPQFPLFRSTNLVNWDLTGSIFPVQPSWAEGSFWAPELVYDEVSQRFCVWYVGKKRNGPLCIAVATASSPVGPYIDYGPLICEEDGSIDPCFARDEHGEPFLIWKEDGNSQGRPTPIWAQHLTEDLLRLDGEKTQLIVNDQSWEEGIVEGPYILRHEGRFYMFYAGNSCCGKECKYAEGVARADRLLGPWEKYSGNPLIAANDRWRCPGHGTAVRVTAQGEREQEYLLYHAYPAGGTIYVGREAVLDEITWSDPDPDGKPGWPSINAGRGPGEPGLSLPVTFVDEFRSQNLGLSWQWPVNTWPDVTIKDGVLNLGIPNNSSLSDRPVESAMVAVPQPSGEYYVASVCLATPGEADPRLWSGLAIVGDPFNTIGLGVRGDALQLWERRGATQQVLWMTAVPLLQPVHLRCASVGTKHHLQFCFSLDSEVWNQAGELYDATSLPAWDRAPRVGLMLEGPQGLRSAFSKFELRSEGRNE